MEAAFAQRRDKAKARGIPWLLTLEQFRAFCDETELLALQGNDAESRTIDRIDNTLPYQLGNIRPLTRWQNSFKRSHFDEIRVRCGMAKRPH